MTNLGVVRAFKRSLIRFLDRPGGRLLLGKIATRSARQATGDDVAMSYLHGLWTHRVGADFFPDGPKFEDIQRAYGRWVGQAARYVSEATDFWLQHYRPREGDVVVDVGAGRGEDTLVFSRAVGNMGRVIAIEAHPLSFAILKNFCRLNRLTNTTLLQLALMDKPGTARIVDSESSWMENAIQYGEGSSGIQVRAGTFEEVWKEQELKDIAFLKMNIEGAERYALVGMGPVIQHIRQISVACHDFRYKNSDGEQFRTRAFVEKFLVDHGFVLASRPDDPRDYVRDHVFGLRTSRGNSG